MLRDQRTTKGPAAVPKAGCHRAIFTLRQERKGGRPFQRVLPCSVQPCFPTPMPSPPDRRDTAVRSALECLTGRTSDASERYITKSLRRSNYSMPYYTRYCTKAPDRSTQNIHKFGIDFLALCGPRLTPARERVPVNRSFDSLPDRAP